jgi:hypothetical protein
MHQKLLRSCQVALDAEPCPAVKLRHETLENQVPPAPSVPALPLWPGSVVLSDSDTYIQFTYLSACLLGSSLVLCSPDCSSSPENSFPFPSFLAPPTKELRKTPVHLQKQPAKTHRIFRLLVHSSCTAFIDSLSKPPRFSLTMSQAAAATSNADLLNIPLYYNPANSQTSASILIYSLFPEWTPAKGGRGVKFIRFTDGITNTVRPLVFSPSTPRNLQC